MPDILGFLKSLRPPEYANNLPGGGPAPAYDPNPAAPITKGDVEAAQQSAPGALGPDPFAYQPEEQDNGERAYRLNDKARRDAAALNKRRAAALSEFERANSRGGPAFMSPEWLSRFQGGGVMPAAAPIEAGGQRADMPALASDSPQPPVNRERQRARSRPPGGALTDAGTSQEPAESGGGALATSASLSPEEQMQLKTVPPGALESGPATASAAQPGAASAAPPSPIDLKSLSDEYNKRVAEIEKDSGQKLNDQQKNQLKMDFFLRLMSLGGRPGVNALASVGEAGLGTEALSGQMTKQNIDLAHEKRREALDTVFRGVGFMDKEQDNARVERHFQAMDARDRQRLSLTAQQVNDGKWSELKSGKSGTYVLYNKQTGETKDTGIALEKSGDKTPAEVQIIERAMKDPQFRQTLIELRSTGKDKNDADQIVDLAGKLANDPMNPRAPQDALSVARDIVMGAKGQSTGEKVEKPTTKAQFDALPKGAKFVNPKDGKTYTKT